MITIHKQRPNIVILLLRHCVLCYLTTSCFRSAVYMAHRSRFLLRYLFIFYYHVVFRQNLCMVYCVDSSSVYFSICTALLQCANLKVPASAFKPLPLRALYVASSSPIPPLTAPDLFAYPDAAKVHSHTSAPVDSVLSLERTDSHPMSISRRFSTSSQLAPPRKLNRMATKHCKQCCFQTVWLLLFHLL